MSARARRAAALLGIVLLLGADQAGAGGRFRLVPALAVGEAYDDNVLFSTINPEADWVTRADPSLEGEYRADALTVNARYMFGAERFRDHPELNRVFARQEAGFNVLGDASPRLKLGARGMYAQTYTPMDLALAGGLDLGRVRAERLDSTGTMTWRASPLNEATLEYAFVRDRVDTGPGGDGHTARVLFDRHTTPRNTLRIGYALRRFTWTSGPEAVGAPATVGETDPVAPPEPAVGTDPSGGTGLTSHVITAGWIRDLGPRARLTLLAGPRLTTGRPTGLEAEGALRVAVRDGEIALAAGQTEERIVGLAEPAVTQVVEATLAAAASRHLRLGLAAGLHRTRFDEGAVVVQRISFEIGWQVASWLSLEAAPHWNRQTSGEGVSTFRDLDHRVFLVRVVTTLPGARTRTPARPPAEPRRPGEESEEP